jgi:uncharacterized protein involved in exopolysaccharide biosynthesis
MNQSPTNAHQPEQPEPRASGPGSASSGPQAPVYPTYYEEEISLLRYVNVLLKRWRLVLGVPLLAAFSAGVFSFLVRPTFSASASFLPEVRSGSRVPAGLASLAAQFGVATGSDAAQAPQFYAQVLKSRELLERILLDRFPDPRAKHNPVAADSNTLVDILKIEGDSVGERVYKGLKTLDKLVSTQVDRQTGIVKLTVEAPYPELAAAVANRMLDRLNEFNTKTRQSQARERRRFVEDRVAAVERELRQAEEDLKNFYERNRSWQSSPQLAVEEDRLRRQVQLRQELYLTLKREYETARIEEVNDTPVITVIEAAVPPLERSKPRRRLNVILAFMVGGMLSLFLAFGAEYFGRSGREEDQDYQEFRSLAGAVWSELGGMLGLKGGSRSR